MTFLDSIRCKLVSFHGFHALYFISCVCFGRPHQRIRHPYLTLLSDAGIWSLLNKETSFYSKCSIISFFFNLGHFVFFGNETPQFIFTKGRRKTIVKGNRTFFVNNKVPQGYGDYLPAKFTKNEIISSKYTVWNFLPVNLFEQFRRVANFYFLSIAVITVLEKKQMMFEARGC